MLSHCIGAHNLVPDKNIAYSKVFLRFPWVSIVPLPMKTQGMGQAFRSNGLNEQGSFLSTGKFGANKEPAELRRPVL